jgi:uncharacterized protein
VSQPAALYHLQMLDSKLDEVRKRLNEIQKQLGADQEVRAAQQLVSDIEADQHEWHSKQLLLELEKSSLQEDINATETRLYGGQIFNPRELTDLQDKLNELKQRIEDLDEPILEAMVNTEDLSQRATLSRADLARILESKAESAGELGKEQIALTHTMVTLESEVQQARSPVEPTGLSLYDRLRAKPGGVSVATIRGSECGGCGVELTSQVVQRVRRGEVVTCPTCGRILYL